MTVQPNACLEATIELLSSLTAWQSVADEPDEQRSLAAWLEAWLAEELEAEVILPVAQQPDDRPPLVHVRVDIGAPDTLKYVCCDARRSRGLAGRPVYRRHPPLAR